MINFTVYPVQSHENVRTIGGENVPYFRTSEFSQTMFENERLIKKFANAPCDSRTVFITGSGTASMEAAVINTLTSQDKVLVVNGGSFGHRFVELLEIHGIPFTAIRLEYGRTLRQEQLSAFDGMGYTAFVVNIHETSTGVLYDIDAISAFCKRNNLFLIVDAISSFLADPIDMERCAIDIMITGSQKALACAPGISVIVLSPKALRRVDESNPKCLYLNLKDALKNGERGQTPFTPAVGILRQINARLKDMEARGGVDVEIGRTAGLAEYFRKQIEGLPFEIFPDTMSNAVTALHPTTASSYDIFLTIKDEYGMWVCPNGGDLKDRIFRVGHIGALTTEDYDKLIDAFKDMQIRGLI